MKKVLVLAVVMLSVIALSSCSSGSVRTDAPIKAHIEQNVRQAKVVRVGHFDQACGKASATRTRIVLDNGIRLEDYNQIVSELSVVEVGDTISYKINSDGKIEFVENVSLNNFLMGPIPPRRRN